MSNELEMIPKPAILARIVAPEDLQPGQYVTVLYQVQQYLRGFFSCEANTPLTLERLEILPADAAAPRLVVEVCLPLVLLKTHRGKHVLIDTRRYKLAAVSTAFVRRVFVELEADRKRSAAKGDETGKEKKKKKK